MARRRVSTSYPQPPTLERTYRKGRTRIDGVRRFLASEGVVPFADDKNGVGRIGGDVWLRPSATRRVGNYLDLTAPAVAGLRVRPDPLARVMALPVDGGSLFDQFTATAAATTRTVIDQSNRLRLVGTTQCGGNWPWEGLLTYEHTVTIDGGERIYTEPMIPMHVREGLDGTVHIAVVLRHNGEFELARKWLSACNLSSRGWHLGPVRVNEEPPERHDEMWAILKDLGDEFLSARNPSMSARERTADTDAAETAFKHFIETVPYRTRPLDWEYIVKRLDEDGLSLAAITGYVWAKRNPGTVRANSAIVAVDLRQRPGRDDYLQLSWSSGRALPNRDQPAFTEALLQDLPLLDWDEDVKVRYLLALWEGITGVDQSAVQGDNAAQASA